MRGNEITNQQAPFVLFDIDSFLFLEEEKKPIIKKIGDLFKSDERKFLELTISPEHIRMLQKVWKKHNVCIGLFTNSVYDVEELADKLDKYYVPYTRLFHFHGWEEIRRFPAIYSFSANEDFISYMSHSSSLHIDRIWEVL